MGSMYPDITTPLERHRQRDGRFGEQSHSAPEAHLGAQQPGPVVVPTLVAHTTTERHGLFRRERQVTHQLAAELRVRTVARENAVEGDGGELIIDGQAYLPARRGDAHAPADQPALEDLAQHAVSDLSELPNDVERAHQRVQRHLRAHPQPGVIIDGTLWVRASKASVNHF